MTAYKRHPTVIAIMLISLALSGCDNGGSAKPSSGASAVRITGHIFDDDGPITKARIEAMDTRNTVVAKSELNGESTYTLAIPAGASYPLIVTAYPESGASAPLKAVLANSLANEQDISAVTTIVVDTALSLGGLTDANLAKAAGAAIAQRKKSGGGSGAGATTQSFKGDPTKQYGGWH